MDQKELQSSTKSGWSGFKILPLISFVILCAMVLVNNGVTFVAEHAYWHFIYEKNNNALSPEVQELELLMNTPALGAEEELVSELARMLKVYPRLKPVVDAPEKYPRSLMLMFTKNPEVLDTLLGYPSWNWEDPGPLQPDEYTNQFPALVQWDPRWAYFPYGDDIIAAYGSGPICLSAVAVHLTQDPHLTPWFLASFAEENGYFLPGTGTRWELMTKGAGELGILGVEMPLDEEILRQQLMAGNPVICSMRQGDFSTGSGQFVVLTSVDTHGNFEMHHPARSKAIEQSYAFDEFGYQIKNLWVFSLA